MPGAQALARPMGCGTSHPQGGKGSAHPLRVVVRTEKASVILLINDWYVRAAQEVIFLYISSLNPAVR